MTGLRRRLRRTGGSLIRRLGLLPDGDPDGLGEDEALGAASLPFSVMVYFPDTLRNLYQLRQWYSPLRALDARHRTGIVCLDSRTAAVVRRELELPVVCAARIGTLEGLVSRSDVALALYVNHNIRNLHPLRFPTMLHAYLGHGESDKAASASNQVKAYDFVLVAGEVGRERLQRNLLRFDAGQHVRLVGRPQLDDGDVVAAPVADPPAANRPTVLYAPTWEGAQPSMAYGSSLTHGEALLRSLLDAREFDVVYRPHPRSGANQAAYAAAGDRLRELIEQAPRTDPGGRYVVDTTELWEVRRTAADLLICDVSAVASDWMTTGKPVIVTVPESREAYLDPDGVLSVAPGLVAAEAGKAAAMVRDQLRGGDVAARAEWVRRTLGDCSPGVATARFLAVCDELVQLRARELAARAGRLAGGGA